ncbi:MAG: CDP-alcohol phosphatidyltransferase family protein [Brevinematia bacterium]
MNDFFTTANIISLVRILLTIPIVVLLWAGGKYYVPALILVIVAYISDVIDGIVARTFGQVSEWGKVLDPLGDKILSTALAITFLQIGVVSLMFAILVVLRDLLISIFSTKMIKNLRFIRGSAIIGKIVTFLLFVFYSTVILSMITGSYVSIVRKIEIAVLFFVVISGVYYLDLYIKSCKSEGTSEQN